MCLEQIVLGILDNFGKEEKIVGDLCVEIRLCYWEWIKGGNLTEWVNCVLTAEWV